MNLSHSPFFKTLCLMLAMACTLASSFCLANVPGGGDGKGPDVSVRDEGGNITLDNGIVSIRINKADASIGSFTYQGMNLFEGGHAGGRFYWSWNAPAFSGPRGTATLNVDPARNGGEYAEVKIHCPWSGKPKDAAMDVDIHYSLRRGAQGYYVTAMLDHPATYPRTDLGEWRSNAYVSPMFDWLSVDALRQRKMPTREEYSTSAPVPGAPKEVTRITSGIHAGQYECKYSYSADLGDLDVWGWSSTSKRIGIWMTVPSHEYYNGGPMKRELTVHMNHTLLNMLNGSHYNMGTKLIMDAGTVFKKTFGPYLVYANTYQGEASDPSSKVVASLWHDAQAQAAAEQSAWPYPWFQHPDYVRKSGRGTVGGTLKVTDPATPAARSAGAWIGLAPDDQGTDFQLQGRTYQFWVKTGADGRFIIPNVIPGVYHLWAFGAGNIGTFQQKNIPVAAGKAVNLGTVQWTPSRVADTVWEIGIPDRDSREFFNGEFNYTQWATYAKCLAEAAARTYTIGKSDWRKDWNYAQFGTAPWTIDFNLADIPDGKSPASLYLAFASSGSRLSATLNGTRIGIHVPQIPSHVPLRLGSHGAFAETRMEIPAGLLKKEANTLTLTQVQRETSSATTQYDYIRLEAPGAKLGKP